MIVRTASAEETMELGAKLGAIARPGWVVGLSGDLGAGKTTFVKGVARGLGADPGGVTSPTFTFLHVYEGRIPVYHLNLYRLETADQVRDLGVDEFIGGNGIALVEWFENVPGVLPPGPAIAMRIKVLEGDAREIDIAGPDEVLKTWLS